MTVKFLYASGCYVVVSVVDCIITLQYMVTCDQEANPIIRWYMLQLGPVIGIIVVKSVGVGILLLFLVVIHNTRRDEYCAHILLLGACATLSSLLWLIM